MVRGERVVVPLLARGFVAHQQFTPLHIERVRGLAQGHVGYKAVPPALIHWPHPDSLLQGGHGTHLVQQSYLLIQRRVRLGLTGQDEVQMVGQQQLAKGLVAVQIVAQEGHATSREARRRALDPTLSGAPFTILLLSPVLRHDELRVQDQDHLLPGLDQHGEQHLMRIVHGAVVLRDRALGTMHQ